jgi:hypothetical protein
VPVSSFNFPLTVSIQPSVIDKLTDDGTGAVQNLTEARRPVGPFRVEKNYAAACSL